MTRGCNLKNQKNKGEKTEIDKRFGKIEKTARPKTELKQKLNKHEGLLVIFKS